MISPYADLMIVHDLLRTSAGSVESVLGELSELSGHSERAIAHYESAIAREAAAGLRPSVLSSKEGLARVLKKRGANGDAERALALFGEVEAESIALGGTHHRLTASRAAHAIRGD